MRGVLDDEPFVVMYCTACEGGVVATPLVNGMLLTIEVLGLYDGVGHFIDDETKSIWQPLTGKALFGPLSGAQMPVKPLELRTVEQLLKSEPELRICRSGNTGSFLFRVVVAAMKSSGILLPFFYKTMARSDNRLPPM